MIFCCSKRVQDRRQFSRFLTSRGLKNSAVEIGVNRGCFAKDFVRTWPGMYYMVDPWRPMEDYNQMRDRDRDADYLEVKRWSEKRANVRVLRMRSDQAATELPNDLDFVYIDANHTYEHVVQDINLWWPKLHSRGILAGHDIFFYHKEYIGVTNAVIDFCSRNNLTADLVPPSKSKAGKRIYDGSWFIEKV